jgi:hypothetical protein
MDRTRPLFYVHEPEKFLSAMLEQDVKIKTIEGLAGNISTEHGRQV